MKQKNHNRRSGRIASTETKQTEYSNQQAKKPELYNVNDEVRLKTGHRQWKGSMVIEKPDGLPRSVLFRTDQGQVFRRNIGDIHKTQAEISARNKVVVLTDLTPAGQESANTLRSPSSSQPICPTPPKTGSSMSTTGTPTQQHSAPSQTLYRTKSGRPVTPLVKLTL